MEPNTMETLLHLAVSWALFGLIWTIQLSHYPSFQFIDEKSFLDFHAHHQRSITIIVMPLMLLELGLSIWLTYHLGWIWAIPLVIVLAIWACTFFISVPLHDQLTLGKNGRIIQRLVDTNWIRTILWTIKALMVSWLAFRYWPN